MAAYHAELLGSAQRLIAREPRQSGRLPAARIRRSISTCYYALFHFLLEDACRRLIRNKSKSLTQRRIVARVFTHAGIKLTLNKIRRQSVDKSLADFLLPKGTTATPHFAKVMATVFIDTQAQRHSADYDLNVAFSETDAREVYENCCDAIEKWQNAVKADDRDFKDALAIVMLLKGQFRKDD